jgi:hypothetical protein
MEEFLPIISQTFYEHFVHTLFHIYQNNESFYDKHKLSTTEYILLLLIMVATSVLFNRKRRKVVNRYEKTNTNETYVDNSEFLTKDEFKKEMKKEMKKMDEKMNKLEERLLEALNKVIKELAEIKNKEVI